MEYLHTSVIQPERKSSTDPRHVGVISLRLTKTEADKLLHFGGHAALQRAVEGMTSSLSAGGSRETDVPGFEDIDFLVGIRTPLDVSDQAAVDQWGRRIFKEMTPFL
jgi:hypothetical protein